MHHKMTIVYPRYITQYLIPVVASLLCFYHKISSYVECAIRRTLIVHFGCRQYFEMRKNELLISPFDSSVATADGKVRRSMMVNRRNGCGEYRSFDYSLI